MYENRDGVSRPIGEANFIIFRILAQLFKNLIFDILSNSYIFAVRYVLHHANCRPINHADITFQTLFVQYVHLLRNILRTSVFDAR